MCTAKKVPDNPDFLQIFKSSTSVCLIISAFCKRYEPICEPEIVLKIHKGNGVLAMFTSLYHLKLRGKH